ncbi:MAG: hypothetical protein M1822_007160 [Bathelium mastoideum]|nr:MAG: hypothetical protein M1822_007160 [Bathelium mastoideum]
MTNLSMMAEGKKHDEIDVTSNFSDVKRGTGDSILSHDGTSDYRSEFYKESLSHVPTRNSRYRAGVFPGIGNVFGRFGLSRLLALFQSEAQPADSRRNDEVEEMLKAWNKEQREEVTTMLLGPDGGGKATLLRHLRILFGEPFKEDERIKWRSAIFRHIICTSVMVTDVMLNHSIEPEDSDFKAHVDCLMPYKNGKDIDELPVETVDAIMRLWVDKGFHRGVIEALNGFNHCPQHSIRDAHFMTNVKRVLTDGYIPTDEDILHTTKNTCGIKALKCDVGERRLQFVELGGSRGERKKWIHQFDDCKAILFLVAIDGYDQKLCEESSRNVMEDILCLFDSVVNSRWFSKSIPLVLFTKIDLFREKIASDRHPFKDTFPEYDGLSTDADAAQEFLAERFRGLCRDPQKLVRVMTVNLLDADSVEQVIESLADVVSDLFFNLRVHCFESPLG